MLRKLGILVASLALVLVSSVALAPAAQAIDDVYFGGGGTSQGGGGKGNPKGPYTKYYPISPTPVSLTFPRHSRNLTVCPVKADGRMFTSYTMFFRELTSQEMKDPQALPDYKSGGRWYYETGIACRYAAPPTETDVNCAWDVTITATGPMSAPKTVFPRTTSRSAWSRTSTSRKNPGLCVSSVTQAAKVKLPTFGKYRMDVIVGLVPCKRVDYPGGSQPSEIKSPCGAPVYVPKVVRAQVWCNGSSDDWSGSHAFTVDECRGGSSSTTAPWWCKVSSVTLDGRASPVGVLDDGKARAATWTKFGVSGGVRKAKNHQTQMVVGKSSTPSRAGVKQDADTQPYQAPGAGWMTGIKLTTPLRWFTPGMPGAPWTLNRSVKFNAEFKVVTVTIESINLLTGKLQLVETTTWRADTGTCPSASLVVSAYRARNTR